MWDVSTSDMTRDVNPGLEGIMQQLCLSPDNRYAAAYTNYNEVHLNDLSFRYRLRGEKVRTFYFQILDRIAELFNQRIYCHTEFIGEF